MLSFKHVRGQQTGEFQMVPFEDRHFCSKMSDLHKLVDHYNLGALAHRETEGRGNSLHRKVKVIINIHAVDKDKGVVVRRWHSFSFRDQYKMIDELEKLAPWLGNFEDSWAAKWLLAKGINQREVDRRRGSRKIGELNFVYQILIVISLTCYSIKANIVWVRKA